MTRHRCGLWLVVAGACLWSGVLSAGLALGQSASQLPPEIRTSSNLTQAQNTAISEAIAQDVAGLQSDDPAAQQKARESLIDGIADKGQVNNTATYKSAYARALNSALVALPVDAGLRTRLNAAIAAAKVAEIAKNTGLTGATEKFLADGEFPVALWGMKSARWILPFQATSALFSADHPLLAAIPAAVQKHPAPAMYEEAYLALAMELFNPAVPKPPAASIGMVVPVVQQLIEDRSKKVAQQPAIEQVLAESRGFSFLAAPEVYRAQNAAQRLRTAQLLLNHLAVVGEKAAAAPQLDKGPYVQAINELGGVAFVIGQNENNNAGIQRVAQVLRQIQINTPPGDITAAIAATPPAFKAVPTFQELKVTADAPTGNTGRPQASPAGSVAGTP